MRVAPLIAFAAALSSPAAAGPRVTLGSGIVEGAPGGAGAIFQGIPFAQPPVGPLRWREPLAPKPWRGVKPATALAPMCIQNRPEGVSGSEDCLYLNVWAPEWPVRRPYPVMLWAFGGANTNGSANNPVFDGASLAKRGVVMVTANYRVGVMGFMAHPALSAESPHKASGNYQLLDQLAALRWIQANIAKFGGDPTKVTLFGQSSGSYDLLLLMASPLSKGLFHRAIAQSGQFLAYSGPMPKARAEAMGAKIAADLKAPSGPAALPYLRGLPAEQVVATGITSMPTAPGTDTGLLTNIDGWVLAEHPAKVFAAGRQLRVPIILGQNAREISFVFTPDEVRQKIEVQYGGRAPKALAAYGLAGGGAGTSDPLLGPVAAQYMTDIVQRCPAILEVAWHAAAGNPTWQYQFERSIPGREAAGAFHGAEVAFVWGNLDEVQDKPAFTAADREASDAMQRYWTNFARTGDPNGGGLPAWPKAGSGRYLAFTMDGPAAKQDLQPGPCGVYRELTLGSLGQ